VTCPAACEITIRQAQVTQASMRAQNILLKPRESEIVGAVLQSEKCIRGKPVESYKLRYFNSLEIFDHTTSTTMVEILAPAH
jgi:hypothetical protein